MKFITKSQIKLPKRKKDSHKGQNGLVLAVGGSENYAGAVALAGLAALRSGRLRQELPQDKLLLLFPKK